MGQFMADFSSILRTCTFSTWSFLLQGCVHQGHDIIMSILEEKIINFLIVTGVTNFGQGIIWTVGMGQFMTDCP